MMTKYFSFLIDAYPFLCQLFFSVFTYEATSRFLGTERHFSSHLKH